MPSGTALDEARQSASQEPYWLGGLYASVTVTRMQSALDGSVRDRSPASTGRTSTLVLTTWPAEPCTPVARCGRGVLPLLLVYGGFAAATDGVGKAWVSSPVAGSRPGSAQGTFQGLSGGAVLVAGLWAGFAWNTTGRLPLLLSGTVAAVLAVGLFLSAYGGSAGSRTARVAG